MSRAETQRLFMNSPWHPLLTAPEVSFLTFSSASDVYAFGVILLELVTGLPSLIHGPTKVALPKSLPAFLRGGSPAVVGAMKGDARVKRWVRASADEVGDPASAAEKGRAANLKVVETLIKLGLSCTEEDMRARPSMASVHAILASVS